MIPTSFCFRLNYTVTNAWVSCGSLLTFHCCIILLAIPSAQDLTRYVAAVETDVLWKVDINPAGQHFKCKCIIFVRGWMRDVMLEAIFADFFFSWRWLSWWEYFRGTVHCCPHMATSGKCSCTEPLVSIKAACMVQLSNWKYIFFIWWFKGLMGRMWHETKWIYQVRTCSKKVTWTVF